MLQVDNGKLYRVDKRIARKTYDVHKPIYLLPCKTRLDNMWLNPCKAVKDAINHISSDGFNSIVARNDFDNLVTCYTYYNCNSELGNYPAFYIERG